MMPREAVLPVDAEAHVGEPDREPEQDEAGESDYQESLARHEEIVLELPPLLRDHGLVGAAAIREASTKAVVYEWQDIAIPGNIIAIAGLPGEGKTTLMMLALTARRNRTGKPISILGRALKPAPLDKWCVLVENEHAGNSASRKLEHSREMHGLDADTFERMIVLGRKDVTVGSDLWAEVCDLIAQGKVDSVWIDSLARFVDGQSKANGEEDQVAVFAEVQRAIESSPDEDKPTVWIICHSNKGGKGVDVKDISGSVQRAAQVDVAIIVTAERGDNGQVTSSRVVFAKIRENEENWPPACVFRVAKSDGKWSVSWGDDAERPDEVPAHERVFALLAKEELTNNQIRDRLRMSGKSVSESIAVLKATKRITMRKRVVAGREVWMSRATDEAVLRSAGILKSAPGANGEVDRELY